MSSNWLSHSVMTRSRPEPSATGSVAPCIHSGVGTLAIEQKVGARSTWPTGSCTSAGEMPADGAGRHTKGTRIERVAVVRALEEEPEVALQLAVVGREHDVGVVAPAAVVDAAQDAAARLVDQLVLDVHERVDLAHLVVRHACGHEASRPAFTVVERAVEPLEPVARLLGQHLAAHVDRSGMARREIEVAPRHARHLGRRWVPGVVRVGEAEPEEPVLVRVERVEPSDGALGEPVGVVVLARDRVRGDLLEVRVATALVVEAAVLHEREEAARLVRVLVAQPGAVVPERDRAVHRELEVLEAPVRTVGELATGATEDVLGPAPLGVEPRLEVGLADERSAVPRRCGSAATLGASWGSGTPFA